MLGSMRQEDRPVRKGSQIDSHFQNRVNRRKDRYRSIMQGEREPEPDDDLLGGDIADPVPEALPVFSSPSPAATAREARQRRLSSRNATKTNENAEFERKEQKEQKKNTEVRMVRAHRLRNFLKVSPDEEDAMYNLEKKRLAQLEQDRLSRQRAAELERREAALKAEEVRQRRILKEEEARQRQALAEERRRLEMERMMLQEAQRNAASEWQLMREAQRKMTSDLERRQRELQEDKLASQSRQLPGELNRHYFIPIGY